MTVIRPSVIVVDCVEVYVPVSVVRPTVLGAAVVVQRMSPVLVVSPADIRMPLVVVEAFNLYRFITGAPPPNV